MPRKITSGPIMAIMVDMTEDEIAVLKSYALAQLNLSNFTKNGISVTITGSPRFENDMYVVDVYAERDGQPLTVDNPLQFYNPPILVPDGTTYEEENALGTLRTLNNYKEDALDAIETMIVQALEVQN